MMAHRSDRSRDTPPNVRGMKPAKQSGTQLADTIRASGHMPTASTGRTEDCTRPTPESDITPCNAGAIHRRHSAPQGAHTKNAAPRWTAVVRLGLGYFGRTRRQSTGRLVLDRANTGHKIGERRLRDHLANDVLTAVRLVCAIA